MNTKSKAYSLSEQEFRTIIQNSDCCSTAMKQMGYKCTTGNSYNVVKRRINELQLDISHWLIGTQKANICSRIPDEEYFVKGYHHSGTNLCKRILETHKIEYKCAICGNTGE